MENKKLEQLKSLEVSLLGIGIDAETVTKLGIGIDAETVTDSRSDGVEQYLVWDVTNGLWEAEVIVRPGSTRARLWRRGQPSAVDMYVAGRPAKSLIRQMVETVNRVYLEQDRDQGQDEPKDKVQIVNLLGYETELRAVSPGSFQARAHRLGYRALLQVNDKEQILCVIERSDGYRSETVDQWVEEPREVPDSPRFWAQVEGCARDLSRRVAQLIVDDFEWAQDQVG